MHSSANLRLRLVISSVMLISALPLMGQWQAHFTDTLALSSSFWMGTLEKFRCDPIRGLQLYDTTPERVANYAYIKASVPISTQMTWHGKIQLDYRPTRSNNLKLLLYCYDALEDGTFNYVVLRMDNDRSLILSENNVTLEQNNNIKLRSSNKILEYDYYQEMRTEGGAIDFVIQYDPTAEERWSMWIRHSNNQLYSFAGRAGDTPRPPAQYKKFTLLLGCVYSKTRAQHSSMEYLEVYPTLIPPEQFTDDSNIILAQDFYRGFEQPDPQTVELLCAEAPDLSAATIAVAPSWGNLTTTTYGNRIRIRSDQAIPEALYILSLRGVRTLSGVQIEDTTYEISIEYDTPPPPRQEMGVLAFSEFMSNPLSGASEYLELHNLSPQPIDAQGYSVGVWRQGKVSKWFPLSDKPCDIPAGGYHAFTTVIEGITAFYATPQDSLTECKALPQLANEGFTIELLRHADSTVVAQFHYDPKLLGKLQNQRGVALERYFGPTSDTTQAVWGAALAQVRYATPGQHNSFIPSGEEIPTDTTETEPLRTLCITEIMARPSVDGSEYIELYNPSDSIPVETGHFGVIIVQSGHPSAVYPLPTHPSGGIPPKSYLALTPSTHPLERLYYTDPDSLLLFTDMPKLPDSACAIRLVSLANEHIVEEVYYDIKTFPKSLQQVKGIAQERIIPDKQPQELSNWTAALEWANYGTPGRQNSVYGQAIDTTKKVDLPTRRTIIPLPQLARLVLQEIADGETTCVATLYTTSGYTLAHYTHSEIETLCRAIVERQPLTTLLPPTLSTQAILVVELQYRDQKKPYHLTSLIAN